MCLCHLVWKQENVNVTCVGELDNLTIGKSCLDAASCWFFFRTGEPSTKKWPVAPESEMAYLTALHTLVY